MCANGFQILPVIVFFSSVISVLYYIGVMQGIVRVIGRFLSFCMGTTPAESLNAAGNIFVGMVTRLCSVLQRPVTLKLSCVIKSSIRRILIRLRRYGNDTACTLSKYLRLKGRLTCAVREQTGNVLQNYLL